MKRVLLRSALIFGVIMLATLLVAVGALRWAAVSESGLQFVWQRVATRLPPGITVATVEGRLAGPLVLGGITVQNEAFELRIERIELRWNPLALLGRTFDVERLDVRVVDVVLLPAEQPAASDEPFRLPTSVNLPVDIRVGSASVEDLRFRSSPNAEPLSIERASVAGVLTADLLELDELVVRGPVLGVSGDASVVPRDGYETSARIDWVVRPLEYPEARGSTQFRGNFEALTIEQRIEAPYDTRVDLRLTEPLGALRLDGDIAFRIQPAAFGIEQAPAETVSSTLSFRGTLEALDLTGRVQLEGGDADGVAADIAALYAGDAVEIQALDLTDGGSAAAIHASGRVMIGAEQPTLELDATWSDLQWPPRGEPQIASELGSLELRGTFRDYAVALDGDLALGDATRGKVSASGTGDAETLTLERIDVETLRGRLEGRITARWAPNLSTSIALTGTDLDPGVLLHEWPGRVAARVRADAALDGEDLKVALHELALDGRLRDRPITLSARGAYGTDSLRIDAFALRSGSTEVSARGTAGTELALEWRIESPDLGEVWPELAGRISGNGELRGPRDGPRVGIEVRGEGLGFMESRVDDFELTADVDVGGQAHSSLMLAFSSAQVLGTAIAQLQLTGEGNAARHALALTTTTSVGTAELGLMGKVGNPWTRGFVWSFELEKATIAYPKLAPWGLREPATGRVTGTEAELDRACWQSDTAELCFAGIHGPARTEAQFALASLRLDYFAALLAEPVRLEGDLSLEGRFEQAGNRAPQLDGSLRASAGRLVPGGDRGIADGGDADEPYALVFGPADGRVTMNDDRFEGSLRVPFAEQGKLEASARVGAGAGAPFAQRALDGQLMVDVASLDFVSDLVTQVQDIQGAVTGDLRVAGTVGRPRVAGSLALEDGRATLPGTNVELEDVELVLAGDGESGVTVGAQARSGGGTLSAEGRVTLSGAGPEGRIAVIGDVFEVVDTVDAQVVVSPDLELALTGDRIELTGSVTVPRARLSPRDTGESAVAVSGDQVIVESGEEADRPTGRPFTANVRLELGDEVRLDAYGLTGRLVGAIEITEKPGEPTAATGELRVQEGIYEAYGQELEIETGRVVFAGGPITEPGLDIEAVRRPTEDIVVGARVRGVLAAPELSLFSEPPMAQQEQLSYLVLGRPLDDTSASESSAMSRAALVLGLRGGNFVSERINENLGLDTFGIETDSDEAASEAAFVIGKYLTPSLYVSYGIGLLDPVKTVKLRYEISKRWRLVTESSSEASGGDVIYNIERGR